MAKDRAEARRERIDGWFSDLIEEFEYSFSADDLRNERERRIQRREGNTKYSSIFSSVSERPARVSNEIPVILISAIEPVSGESENTFNAQLYEHLNNLVTNHELAVLLEQNEESANEETVKNIARKHNASIVIWGYQKEEFLHLFMDIQKLLSVTEEQNSNLNVAPPRRVTFKPFRDITASIPYLSKFFLGSGFFSNGDAQKAGLYFEEALEQLPENDSISIGQDESLLFRVIWSYS